MLLKKLKHIIIFLKPFLYDSSPVARCIVMLETDMKLIKCYSRNRCRRWATIRRQAPASADVSSGIKKRNAYKKILPIPCLYLHSLQIFSCGMSDPWICAAFATPCHQRHKKNLDSSEKTTFIHSSNVRCWRFLANKKPISLDLQR